MNPRIRIPDYAPAMYLIFSEMSLRFSIELTKIGQFQISVSIIEIKNELEFDENDFHLEQI